MEPSDISPSTSQIVFAFADLEKKEGDAGDLGSVETVKIGKNSILNSVNKSASQFKKLPQRKLSPLLWFPRKKTDSYLQRKIKLLQKEGGMNSSLAETLGDSNPHYTRVEREKIAAREAARKAMETRKAAMVEASWCRILQAARIPSKDAASRLAEAVSNVEKAFEEAKAMGVIMYDKPDCPRQPCEVETSSNHGGGSTHTVTASFETAFEVDKEVAAAVKKAFIRFANYPNPSNKEEFRELLWTISQNPDTGETNQEILELSSECESEAGSKSEPKEHAAGFSSRSSELAELVDVMLDRLKNLQEEELSSLATIVATCGLNAVLEEESSKHHGNDFATPNCTVSPTSTRNVPLMGSTQHSNIPFINGQMKKKQGMTEVPSLDKFLVKHVSKLEREVQEAKNARKNDQMEESGKAMEISEHVSERSLVDSSNGTSSEAILDLGSVLVRHTSRLEKEIEEAKKSQRKFEVLDTFGDVQDTKLEVMNQNPKQSAEVIKLDDMVASFCINDKQVNKENKDVNRSVPMKEIAQVGGITRLPQRNHMSRIEKAKLEALEAFAVCNSKGMNSIHENNSLDKVLVKSMHRLESEKMQAQTTDKDPATLRDQKKHGDMVTDLESLDKVLVKHVSRLEKEKMAAHSKEDVVKVKDQQRVATDGSLDSLDKVLVKHVSRLEKEKLAAHAKEDVVKVKDRQRVTTCGTLEGLDKVLVKHVSRLEKEKMAAHSKEDLVKLKDQQRVATGGSLESLDKVLVKHVSRLEKENLAAHAKEDLVKVKDQQRVMTDGSLESLDKVLVKHVSRLEKEKSAAHAKEDLVKVKDRQRVTTDGSLESLDKVLVKHVSRLEKEKMASHAQEDVMKVKKDQQQVTIGGSLDEILVKHHYRDKLTSSQQSSNADHIRHPESRRKARERELLEAWGGFSLGNSIRPHLSRLEQDKVAWARAEEEEQS